MGYPVVNVRQQAMRGLAHASQADGDVPGAMCIYERLLGAAHLGRTQATHWMHGDYGWLHLQQGNLKVTLRPWFINRLWVTHNIVSMPLL